jgi:hypothetical protein
MAIRLYCLLTPVVPDAVPSGLTGVGGAPVRAIASREVEAWVSDVLDVRTRDVDPREILAHSAVADAAVAGGRTPLPARFGQLFEDEAALWRALTPQRASMARAFERVAGHVEMGVIVAPALRRMLDALQPVKGAVLDATARGAGMRYLEEVRARSRAEERLSAGVRRAADRASAAVASFVHGEARQELQADRGVLALAHLIRREQEAEYRSTVAALPEGEGDDRWQFVVAGPRAPFSFVALGADGLTGTEPAQ